MWSVCSHTVVCSIVSGSGCGCLIESFSAEIIIIIANFLIVPGFIASIINNNSKLYIYVLIT